MLAQLQKVGKGLMMPVAVLPAAGLLLRLGQPDVLDWPWMANAGDAVFSNLPLLFAVGLSVSLAKDSGVAGLSGVVAYFVMTNVAVTINAEINMGVLAGLIAGILAANMYGRFKDTKLPDYLGFFGGRRFVPIVTAGAATVLGLIFGFIWPPIQHGIGAVGNWMTAAGAIGVGVFGLLNRLLIPLGLHHVINSIVWFMFGEFQKPDGTVATGDLWRFFAGDPSAGFFMAGWFPIMMFGLIGAAFAMTHAARPENRKRVGGIMLSAAFTSFLTGITEPIEFAFMFVAPLLYAIHAVLAGTSMAIAQLLDIHHGFTFSAGLIDFVLNYGIASDNAWLLIPIGLVYGVVYYVVFRWVIVRFNIPTPGREPEESHVPGV
ncbi:PTS transporter subunit EIIC [Symbiobacterium thermophilum]|uniref:PTS system N-acetylglucosamine-specific enzyme IIABC component n=2 Tax=Symbiobacterium thermophilum TaxID=2734 RepID=Q67SK8_SYMTH|nr:PTS transporter subunit EIIC [Symbiobacterium thermophilum]BAD39335.1 PTS system N-acetylglucosamine-specific enzyme IIABC component [Symbiobacterium thermophilum IAM 14863]